MRSSASTAHTASSICRVELLPCTATIVSNKNVAWEQSGLAVSAAQDSVTPQERTRAYGERKCLDSIAHSNASDETAGWGFGLASSFSWTVAILPACVVSRRTDDQGPVHARVVCSE